MESVFENQYVRTKDMFQRLCVRSMFLTPASILLQVLFISLLAWLSVGRGIWWMLPIALLFFYGILLWRCFGTVNLLWKREQELSKNQAVVYTLEFFEDHLQYSTTLGTVITFAYTDIVRVMRTRGYWYLLTRAKQAVVVKEGAFIKGEESEFPVFLYKRGFRA